MGRLLTLGYWFSVMTDGEFAQYKIALGISIAMLILAVGMYIAYKLKFYKSHYKRLIRSSSSWLLFFSITLLFLTFFRLENAFFLSMRIWFLLLFIGFITWLFFLGRSIKRELKKHVLHTELSKIRESKEMEQEKMLRYLPKKKGKKKSK